MDASGWTTGGGHATTEGMSLLAKALTFFLISIGAMLLGLDILLLLAGIVEGPGELEATTGWWDLLAGLGVPAIAMLALGIFLERRLPRQ